MPPGDSRGTQRHLLTMLLVPGGTYHAQNLYHTLYKLSSNTEKKSAISPSHAIVLQPDPATWVVGHYIIYSTNIPQITANAESHRVAIASHPLLENSELPVPLHTQSEVQNQKGI